jgi:hypothetical protein
VIHPVGERQWKGHQLEWQGHHTCVNPELGTFCRLLYIDMVPVGGR